MELEETISRLIRDAENRQEFLTLEDGFVYYCPDPTLSGALPPWVLRALADELDRRNAEWAAVLERYYQHEDSAPAAHSVDDIRLPGQSSFTLCYTDTGELPPNPKAKSGDSAI